MTSQRARKAAERDLSLELDRSWKRLDALNLIIATPGTCSGEPRVKGTRVPVARIVGYFMGGASLEETAAAYSLTLDQVYAAVRFQLRRRRCRRSA